MPIRKRIKRLKNDIKDRLGLSSPGRSTTSLPNTRQPSPSPVPQTSQRPVTPLPETSASSAQIDDGSRLLSPTSLVQSQVIATITTSVLPIPVPDSPPSVPAPAPALASSQTLCSNEVTDVERMKSTAWAGLKTLLKVLDASADIFPPLKSAVGGLNQCIDIFEVFYPCRLFSSCTSSLFNVNRVSRRGAKTMLNYGRGSTSLLEDLSQFLGGPTCTMMTTSMKNLAM